jgi:4-hydroxybenzoyl-CoA reductase subunit beta
MLPFAPTFDYDAPTDVDTAVRLLAREGAVALAGGTDLLPSMKHGLFTPRHVVSLARIPELRAVSALPDGGVALGACLTLRDVQRSTLVQTQWPALAAACRTVGTSTIQAMGTLGGNVLLDTRCVYYNQPEGWRQSIGYCLKKSGSVCHVAPKGRGCYAAHSADTVPALWLYDAQVELAGPDGRRTVRVADLYAEDGMQHLKLRRGEVLVALRLPPPSAPVVHRKARTRAAIDYGWLLVAVSRDTSGAYRAVVSAVGSAPVELRADSAEALAEAAFRGVQPLATHLLPAPYRKKMVRVEVRRAAEALA